MADKLWDIVVIGGGPAGVAAGIYAGRSRLDTLLIERGLIGGNINNTEKIENYPGFPGGIAAFDLVAKFKAHAEEFGMETINTAVTGISRDGNINVIETEDGQVRSKVLIIATGSSPVKLGVPGEKELWGFGISSCATCDGPLYDGVDVAVVGGGNAAVEEAIFLTRFASKVTIIHRRDELRAIEIFRERARTEPKIDFEWDSVVEKINGANGSVSGVEIKNLKTGATKELKVEGVFIFIGLIPHSAWIGDVVKKDEDGYITVDRDLNTSVPGIFAAGDVTNKLYRQIAISTGEGARAALAAEKYLIEEFDCK